jgi:hypothetical protein
MSSFVKYCRFNHQIELTPYKTQKEGLDAFSQNPSYWDGIILDAKVLDERMDFLHNSVAHRIISPSIFNTEMTDLVHRLEKEYGVKISTSI